MDLKLKGITWVGNIYQKFEAVCQEVDNIVTQDAIKYVENQVQNAGENVKKLYSNVQDLIPPVVVPTKHKSQCQSPRRNAVVISLLNSTRAENEIWKDDADTEDRQSHEPIAFDLPEDSQDPVANGQYSVNHIKVEQPICKRIEPDSTESKSEVRLKGGSQISFEHNAAKSTPLAVDSTISESSFQTSLSMESCDGAQNLNEARFGQREDVDVCVEEVSQIFDNVVVETSTASSFTVERINPETTAEKTHSDLRENYVGSIEQKIEDVTTEVTKFVSPIEEMSFKTLISVQSSDNTYQNVSGFHVGGKEEANSSVKHSHIIAENAAKESVALFPDKLSPKDGSFEASNIDPSVDDFGGSESDSTNSSMESIALSDSPKLEESCVVVDDMDSQLHAVSSRVQKLRSYRKRIQDVFSSKKRLVKEYELLAVWYGDSGIESDQDNSRTLPACDSEWELL